MTVLFDSGVGLFDDAQGLFDDAGVVNITQPVSGLETTSAFSAPTAEATQNPVTAITGIEATSTFGSVSAEGTQFAYPDVTGLELQSSVGTVTSNGVRNVSVSITGLAADSSVGSATASALNPQITQPGKSKKNVKFLPFAHHNIEYVPEPTHAHVKVSVLPAFTSIGQISVKTSKSIPARVSVPSLQIESFSFNLQASGIINPTDEELIYLLAA
jgi:hypothetical protein